MCTRKSLLTILGVAILGALLVAPSAPAWSTNTNYLTFNTPVSLPGVTLAPGTYIFRQPSETDSNIVQVLKRDRSASYYMGITHPVARTNFQKGAIVSMGEAKPGQAVPISVWFPLGEREGHSFVYGR
jgi:hypothetical protein